MASASPPPIDIARILDEGSWGGYQKLVLLLAALAFAVDSPVSNHRRDR